MIEAPSDLACWLLTAITFLNSVCTVKIDDIIAKNFIQHSTTCGETFHNKDKGNRLKAMLQVLSGLDLFNSIQLIYAV